MERSASENLTELPSWLTELLGRPENERLEVKEAKGNFHFDKLVKYCCALANEGGGHFVMGVSDALPRKIVGTESFPSFEKTKGDLVALLRFRVDGEEFHTPEGRVIVFKIPSRPVGMPIAIEGAYWMRSGESLVPMTQDQLRRIFDEATPDWSAEICPGLLAADLAPASVSRFQELWAQKTGRSEILSWPAQQVLQDAELVYHDGVTYAALVLMGTRSVLSRHLAQAEVVFEYRSTATPGPAEQREELRDGFLAIADRLWELVNLRNARQHFQDGLLMREIATFNEAAIRESVLNAISHRDYRLAGSIFLRQFPQHIEIVSPGGFPPGITPSNIIDRQYPRNRRIAEALARCGFVERSGQGANRIFEACIRESKSLPDFSQSDDWQVSLVLQGQMRDPAFVRFLERLAQEVGSSISTQDFLVLDLVHREQPIPEALQGRLTHLRTIGALESVGRGRGQRWLPSRRFFEFSGDKGDYTRRRGLDHNTHKELLIKHLTESGDAGAPIADLEHVIPQLARGDVKKLLQELRKDGRVLLEGTKRGSRWLLNHNEP